MSHRNVTSNSENELQIFSVFSQSAAEIHQSKSPRFLGRLSGELIRDSNHRQQDWESKLPPIKTETPWNNSIWGGDDCCISLTTTLMEVSELIQTYCQLNVKSSRPLSYLHLLLFSLSLITLMSLSSLSVLYITLLWRTLGKLSAHYGSDLQAPLYWLVVTFKWCRNWSYCSLNISPVYWVSAKSLEPTMGLIYSTLSLMDV